MPLTTDLPRIRTALDRDRTWSAYAIGDLDPAASSGLFVVRTCRGPGYACPFYTALRAADSLRHRRSGASLGECLPSSTRRRSLCTCCRKRSLLFRPHTAATDTRSMWRMTVNAGSFRPGASDDARRWTRHMRRRWRRCSRTPVRAVKSRRSTSRRCLRTDRSAGFGRARISWPSRARIFSRLCSASALSATSTRAAIAGGAGLRARDRAVVRHALAASIPTIVLNVSQSNDAARNVYEQLGFRVHCAFVEGEARSTSLGAHRVSRADTCRAPRGNCGGKNTCHREQARRACRHSAVRRREPVEERACRPHRADGQRQADDDSGRHHP